jgi:hypothetical protein
MVKPNEGDGQKVTKGAGRAMNYEEDDGGK